MSAGRLNIAVYSSREFYLTSDRTLELCDCLGKNLAESSIGPITLITGGMTGVQEAVARSFEDAVERMHRRSTHRILHLAPPGLDYRFDFGDWQVVGQNFEDNRAHVARAADIYIIIDGGPGTSRLAKAAAKRGAMVLCMRSTGGAASGKYWMPASILSQPQYVSAPLWKALGSKTARVSAEAVLQLCMLKAQSKL